MIFIPNPSFVEWYLTFKERDVDNNGALDPGELAECLQLLGMNPSEEDLEFMIKQFDKNGTYYSAFQTFRQSAFRKRNKNTEYFAQIQFDFQKDKPKTISEIYSKGVKSSRLSDIPKCLVVLSCCMHNDSKRKSNNVQINRKNTDSLNVCM